MKHVLGAAVHERVDLKMRRAVLEHAKYWRGEQHIAVVAQLDHQHPVQRGEVYGIRQHRRTISALTATLNAHASGAQRFQHQRRVQVLEAFQMAEWTLALKARAARQIEIQRRGVRAERRRVARIGGAVDRNQPEIERGGDVHESPNRW